MSCAADLPHCCLFYREKLLRAKTAFGSSTYTDGKGHQAFALTVGKVGAPSAPFLFHSAKEPGPSLSPCEGEYVTLSKTAQQLVHYRQFAADLGYTDQLSQPSIMLEDNDSARKLTTAFSSGEVLSTVVELQGLEADRILSMVPQALQ